MKEDVLEQVVDDYLKFKGSFTTHNVGFDRAKTIRNTSATRTRFAPMSMSLAITQRDLGSIA